MGKMMLLLVALAATTTAFAGEKASSGFRIVFRDATAERPGSEADEIVQTGRGVSVKSGKFIETYSFGDCGRAALTGILADFSRGGDGAGGCAFGAKRGVIEITRGGEKKQEIAWCRGWGYPFPMIAMALEKCGKHDK
jgi:hypothetical protein